jgi:hypothetical protein
VESLSYKGCGQEVSPERPILAVSQVFDLAEAISVRYRALILLGSFGTLSWGELAGLRRSDIDLHHAPSASIGRSSNSKMASSCLSRRSQPQGDASSCSPS